MSAQQRNCPSCGSVLPADASDGCCPQCVGAGSLQSASTVVAPPAAAEPASVRASGESGSTPTRAGSLLAPGRLFGRYRIVRLLGKGGMGEVYEADDVESGRRLALKVLAHALDSAEARRRFLREGRLAAAINHPNSVYIFGSEEIGGTPVIAMELVRGGTLKDLVQQTGPLGVRQAVDAILQVIGGLAAAQATGVLHRDVKPSNCFRDDEGGVKVGDFGLSVSTLARTEASLTLSGTVIGTPAFSAPEQLRGEELDVRSDIYAVGMTLYYLLTGRPAFEDDNMVKLLATVLEQPPVSPVKLRRGIPRDLAQVVLRCLAKRPADRFRSYEELRQALLPLSSAAPVPAGLGVRFVAGAVDFVLLAGFVGLLEMIWVPEFLSWKDPALFYSPRFLAYAVVACLSDFMYFGILEGRWGASAGKALFRLRVVGPNRDAPGILIATWRSILLRLLPYAFYWAGFAVDAKSMNAGPLAFWGLLLSILFPPLLLLTARRRNGLAGIHDLLSNTRVIQKSDYGARPTLPALKQAAPTIDRLPKLGPYHVLGSLGGASLQPHRSEGAATGHAASPNRPPPARATTSGPQNSVAGWNRCCTKLRRSPGSAGCSFWPDACCLGLGASVFSRWVFSSSSGGLAVILILSPWGSRWSA